MVLRYNVAWMKMDIYTLPFMLLAVHHTSSGSLLRIHASPLPRLPQGSSIRTIVQSESSDQGTRSPSSRIFPSSSFNK